MADPLAASSCHGNALPSPGQLPLCCVFGSEILQSLLHVYAHRYMSVCTCVHECVKERGNNK